MNSTPHKAIPVSDKTKDHHEGIKAPEEHQDTKKHEENDFLEIFLVFLGA
jgi:hypothetical protein